MFSITKSDDPRPKLRVTKRTLASSEPHATQTELDTVDRDDEERAGVTKLDDCLGFETFERTAADDELGFACFSVALSFNDLAREEDAFEVEYREVVIVQFFGSVERYGVIQRSNACADAADRGCHCRIVVEDS